MNGMLPGMDMCGKITYRTHWSRRVAYSSMYCVNDNHIKPPTERHAHTLTRSVDDLHKAHPVVNNHLFPVSIFYSGIIGLRASPSISMEANQGSIAYFCENIRRTRQAMDKLRIMGLDSNAPTKQLSVNYGEKGDE